MNIRRYPFFLSLHSILLWEATSVAQPSSGNNLEALMFEMDRRGDWEYIMAQPAQIFITDGYNIYIDNSSIKIENRNAQFNLKNGGNSNFLWGGKIVIYTYFADCGMRKYRKIGLFLDDQKIQQLGGWKSENKHNSRLFTKVCNYKPSPVLPPSPPPEAAPVQVTPVEVENDVKVNNISKIEDAKKRCASLGYVLLSEKFGQCVLKLSK